MFSNTMYYYVLHWLNNCALGHLIAIGTRGIFLLHICSISHNSSSPSVLISKHCNKRVSGLYGLYGRKNIWWEKVVAASGDFLARKVLVQCLVATLQDIMAVLHSCCFKFSLKTGTMIIGALLFTFSIIFLLVSQNNIVF